MRTIRTKVYKFEELSATAKQVAISNERDNYGRYGDPLDGFIEFCKEGLKEKGFGDCELRYSLSNSQGDGLSFKTTNLDIERFIKESIPTVKTSVLNALKSIFEWDISGNTGHYTYASKSDVEVEQYDYNKEYDNLTTLAHQVKGYITTEYLNTCKQLEDIGYQWIESEHNEENVIERLNINEVEFTIDGKVFNC